MPNRLRNSNIARWGTASAAVLITVLLCHTDLAAQCAMCRTALTQSAEGERWSRGINAGIMLLLLAPFLIAGGGLLVIYRNNVTAAMRRLRLRLRSTGTQPSVVTTALPDSQRSL